MRVSGAQLDVTRDISRNLGAILCAIERAASDEADILLTPEGSLSGYTRSSTPLQYGPPWRRSPQRPPMHVSVLRLARALSKTIASATIRYDSTAVTETTWASTAKSYVAEPWKSSPGAR